jgi:hypothetical protein
MVESANEPIGDDRADFDVSTIKEAKSLSTIGVVIGAVIPGVLFVFLLIVGALAPAEPAAEPPADVATDAMAVEEAAAEAVEAAEAAAAEVDPAPLGEYTISATGRPSIWVNFNADGTYDDEAAGGKWTYDENGVLCLTDNGTVFAICSQKTSGNDDLSTWANTVNPSVQFNLEKVYPDAMEPAY